jgi:hypothetical protein
MCNLLICTVGLGQINGMQALPNEWKPPELFAVGLLGLVRIEVCQHFIKCAVIEISQLTKGFGAFLQSLPDILRHLVRQNQQLFLIGVESVRQSMNEGFRHSSFKIQCVPLRRYSCPHVFSRQGFST